MIKQTDAITLFGENFDRTQALISAIDTIRAYNSIYQMNLKWPLEDRKMVKRIQESEFKWIQQSCGEHAIISLATAFETYYKELFQQLLAQFPSYFTSITTKYTSAIKELIDSEVESTYEDIEAKLNLRNRFDYYALFKVYSIPFLNKEENDFIEYIYTHRNNLVHNAGRLDIKTKTKLQSIPKPFDEERISTEAKRLRTKFGRMIPNVNQRIIDSLKRANTWVTTYPLQLIQTLGATIRVKLYKSGQKQEKDNGMQRIYYDYNESNNIFVGFAASLSNLMHFFCLGIETE